MIPATVEQITAQETVAGEIARAWSCELRPFGALHEIDYFAERAGRVIGLVEIKCRSHPVDQYPTVFLALRKWLALTLAALGPGVPAVYVVRFTDQTRWIDVRDVDTSRLRVAGRPWRAGADYDREPIIDLPVDELRPIAGIGAAPLEAELRT